MAVLTERTTWQKPRDPKATRRSVDLTPEEQAHVRAALRWLATRHGGVRKLAAMLGATKATVARGTLSRGTVGAGLAIRAARLAGASVEDVLAGIWPPEGACAHCGRLR
ncbi:MAG TPA: hypothetical protein VGM06_13520 [Polyangiaceae bacterium]